MSLADHCGGDYLGEGHHLVAIRSFDVFFYKTGAEGVEFRMADDNGRTTRLSFLTQPKCQWVLASFATACGMSKEEMEEYHPEKGGHDVMLNRKVLVGVIKCESDSGKTYHEVDKDSKAWWKADGQQPISQPAEQPKPAGERFVEPAEDPDEIPF